MKKTGWQPRKEKCNTGTDGLLFLGNRLNPKITIGRPSDSSLDAWFNRKSDQVLQWKMGGGRFTNEDIGRNHCCQVELPQAFDGQKTYLLKMPANKSLQLQPGIWDACDTCYEREGCQYMFVWELCNG